MRRCNGRTRAFAGIAAALSAALLLGACGGTADRAAAPVESDLSAVNVQGSVGTFVSVENQLTPSWARGGISITWRVTNTQNKYWESQSRPDSAPPKGFESLVQTPGSGEYRVRLDVNSFATNPSFVLTPVASVDGQEFSLSPITFEFVNTSSVQRPGGSRGAGWWMRNDDRKCDFTSADQALTQSWTERTPKGLLAYDVVLTCPDFVQGPSQVLIRTSARG